MTATLRAMTGNATSGGESPCTRNESRLQTNFSVMQAVRRFWPTNTLIELKDATKRSDRMCQYWLSNKFSLSADDLADLLRTEAGFAILEEIMGAAKPLWWKDFKRSVGRAQIRREQKALAKRLEEIEQGELDL